MIHHSIFVANYFPYHLAVTPQLLVEKRSAVILTAPQSAGRYHHN